MFPFVNFHAPHLMTSTKQNFVGRKVLKALGGTQIKPPPSPSLSGSCSMLCRVWGSSSSLQASVCLITLSQKRFGSSWE